MRVQLRSLPSPISEEFQGGGGAVEIGSPSYRVGSASQTDDAESCSRVFCWGNFKYPDLDIKTVIKYQCIMGYNEPI